MRSRMVGTIGWRASALAICRPRYVHHPLEHPAAGSAGVRPAGARGTMGWRSNSGGCSPAPRTNGLRRRSVTVIQHRFNVVNGNPVNAVNFVKPALLSWSRAGCEVEVLEPSAGFRMPKAGQVLVGSRSRSPYSFPPGAAMGRFGPPGFPAALIAVATLYTLVSGRSIVVIGPGRTSAAASRARLRRHSGWSHLFRGPRPSPAPMSRVRGVCPFRTTNRLCPCNLNTGELHEEET